MSSMRWGIPQSSDAAFRGRAGVVIEVAPGRFCSCVMTGTFGEIDLECSDFQVNSWDVLAPIYLPGPTEVHMVLTGTLSSMEEEARRPAWAKAEHVLDYRREIER